MSVTGTLKGARLRSENLCLPIWCEACGRQEQLEQSIEERIVVDRHVCSHCEERALHWPLTTSKE